MWGSGFKGLRPQSLEYGLAGVSGKGLGCGAKGLDWGC